MAEALKPLACDHPRRNGAPLTYPLVGILCLALGLLIAVVGFKTVAVTVGLVVAAVIFYRPYIGFLLVVASIPTDVTGILGDSSAVVVLSVTKILAILTVLAAGLEILLSRSIPPMRRLLTPQTSGLILLVGAAVLSAAIHPSQACAQEISRLVTIMIFVMIVIYFVDRPERVEHVILTIAIVATVVAVQSILQRAGGNAIVSEQWVPRAGTVADVSEEDIGRMIRTTGTFSHPAWLGLFLSIAVPLTLFLSWLADRWWVVLAGLFAAVVQILGIFSTYSRMAYIGGAIGVILFMIRRRYGIALVTGVVLAGVVLFPALPRDFRLRAWSILDYTKSSSSLTRIGQYRAGLSMFQRHPAVGIGPGNFESAVVAYRDTTPEPYRVEPTGAHNMYIEIAAELGIPGLVLIVYILGSAFRDAWRRRRDDRANGNDRGAMMWECLSIALVVFVVSAMFVHAQYVREAWLLIALAAAGRNLRATSGRFVGQGVTGQ